MSPSKIFISYSHQDEQFKENLISHLSSLKRRGLINEWHDRKILPGDNWDKNIKQELLDANIILLLISSDFIASNYCYDVEITKAIERHESKEAILIPIILRPCDWKDLPFSKIQGLPKDALPLTKWENVDDAYLNIIDGIKTVLSKNQNSKPNIEIQNDNKLTFTHNVIVCKLPRGYIEIRDFTYRESESWAIVMSYNDYEDGFRGATHYHSSYKRRWETLEGQEAQCSKLRIQKSDWIFTSSIFDLVVELREEKSIINIEEKLKNYEYAPNHFEYHKENEIIDIIKVPLDFIAYNKNGEIRDIIEDLRIDTWKNYNLNTLHSQFESYRRKAYLILFDKIPNHPALLFIKEIVDKYNENFNLEELRTWSEKLSDSLNNACKYIK